MNGTLDAVINVGVIGCGHWGPNHIRVFHGMDGCKVAAIADTDPARLKRGAHTAQGARCVSDSLDLIRDPSVHAVVVATPTVTHYSIVKQALLQGKHVLCEKPLCADPTEADELAALARERGVILMVGHIFLFNAGLQKLKELIDAGEIGFVRSLAAIRTNLGPVRSDVNAAWDLASHDISVFNWLLGSEPSEVQAMGACFIRESIEDVVHISLRYPGNVLASIQCSWLDPKKIRQLTVVGSRRMATWDDLALSNPVAIYEKAVETTRQVGDYGEFLRLSMFDGDVRLPKIAPTEPLRDQNSAFLHAIRTHLNPRSDGNFAAGVVRVLKRVQQALRPSNP